MLVPSEVISPDHGGGAQTSQLGNAHGVVPHAGSRGQAVLPQWVAPDGEGRGWDQHDGGVGQGWGAPW
jgi:hypothetical protein